MIKHMTSYFIEKVLLVGFINSLFIRYTEGMIFFLHCHANKANSSLGRMPSKHYRVFGDL